MATTIRVKLRARFAVFLFFMSHIRNFCIIAHIDHGKSTLADRMLELTGTIEKRKMRNQILDQMELEQERGITIKLQPVRMEYRYKGQPYILNLIDTPGHVDFSYEVSRSLAACEGAILLVDATQGIQAQTLANLHLAQEQGLCIIPMINKIDLAFADVARVRAELMHLLGCNKDDILLVSAKTGQGVSEALAATIERIPPPLISIEKPLRALIFDSKYDEYRGVVAFIRVVEGILISSEKLFLLGTGTQFESLEVGYFRPHLVRSDRLIAGEIGYIVTGMKEVSRCRVGDTVVKAVDMKQAPIAPLPGYREVKPMVFAGIFCREGDDVEFLRDAMEKLKLSDAALQFEPEKSNALGFGFRCGFLGLLHLEIVQERLLREYGLNLIVTTPSVAYRVFLKNKTEPIVIKGSFELPDPSVIDRIEEPMMSIDIVCPRDYVGSVMTLAQNRRAVYLTTEYIHEKTCILHYQIPMASLLTDFYDKLKSVTSGFASLNYEFTDYHEADVVRLDILIATEIVEAFSTITYRETAYQDGRRVVERLKTLLPRQMFEVKIQAALGAKIIASERIPALRKDVTAKLYGGDVTRKRKLLEKQKKGKKKMKEVGRVHIPSEVFIELLRR